MKRQELEVLLISFRESADLVKRTVSERGYAATILLDVRAFPTFTTVPIALSPVRHVRDMPAEPEDVTLGDEALLPVQAAGLSPESPS